MTDDTDTNTDDEDSTSTDEQARMTPETGAATRRPQDLRRGGEPEQGAHTDADDDEDDDG